LIHPPLEGVLPALNISASEETRHSVELLSGAVALIGIGIAAFLFLGERKLATAMAQSSAGQLLSRLWLSGWGFDWVYDKLFVRPYLFVVNLLRHDFIDQGIGLIPGVARRAHDAFSVTENGRLRWYAASMVFGAVVVLAALIVLSSNFKG